MKVTMSNNEVKVNGSKVGTYGQGLRNIWIATYQLNGIVYQEHQRKLSDLRDIVKLSIMEG